MARPRMDRRGARPRNRDVRRRGGSEAHGPAPARAPAPERGPRCVRLRLGRVCRGGRGRVLLGPGAWRGAPRAPRPQLAPRRRRGDVWPVPRRIPLDVSRHVRPEDAEAATALEERLGDLVTVGYDDIGDLGRLDDGEPHWGGAGIRAGSEGSNHCTSAFTIRLANGNKGSVTAAHCFSLTGDGTLNGRNVYSGPEFYGQTEGASNFPTYDMVRIAPHGETFDNKIHTDPCCPSCCRRRRREPLQHVVPLSEYEPGHLRP